MSVLPAAEVQLSLSTSVRALNETMKSQYLSSIMIILARTWAVLRHVFLIVILRATKQAVRVPLSQVAENEIQAVGGLYKDTHSASSSSLTADAQAHR